MGARPTYVNGKRISGGSSVTVFANPEDEPTEVLETLQIGDTVFSLPQGGGGASGSRDIQISTAVTVTEVT